MTTKIDPSYVAQLERCLKAFLPHIRHKIESNKGLLRDPLIGSQAFATLSQLADEAWLLVETPPPQAPVTLRSDLNDELERAEKIASERGLKFAIDCDPNLAHRWSICAGEQDTLLQQMPYDSYIGPQSLSLQEALDHFFEAYPD
jgi:hypothetical protein